jgi:hypothetical protein
LYRMARGSERELRLSSVIVSALLLLGVVMQVFVAQISFLRTRLPAIGATLPATQVMTPGIEFVRTHVPAGEPILYLTGDKGVSDLFSYYQMSYSLAPRNAIWWAVPAPAGKVADWWQDARGGSQGIHRLAAYDHARYVVFAGTDVPADLRPSAEWTMQDRFVVVEL